VFTVIEMHRIIDIASIQSIHACGNESRRMCKLSRTKTTHKKLGDHDKVSFSVAR
jgi:hypothetical protein